MLSVETFLNRVNKDDVCKIKISSKSNPRLAKYLSSKASVGEDLINIKLDKVKINHFNELLCYNIYDLTITYVNNKRKAIASLSLNNIDTDALRLEVFLDYLSYPKTKDYNINVYTLTNNINPQIL